MQTLRSPFEKSHLDRARECENVPHLADRMVIDLVNGLEASANHIRYKKAQRRSGKVWDFLTGDASRRELLFQEQHQESLEVVTKWITGLTRESAHTMETLKYVTVQCTRLKSDFARFTGQVTAEFCRQQDMIENLVRAVSEQHKTTSGRVISLEVHVAIHSAIEAMKRGRLYDGYPTLIKAAFFVDDFCRGVLGNQIFVDIKNQQFLEDALANWVDDSLGTRSPWLPLEDWIRIGLERTEESRVLITEYLMMDDDRIDFHQVLGTAIRTSTLPECVLSAQENGVLQGYYDTEDIVRCLIVEARERDMFCERGFA